MFFVARPTPTIAPTMAWDVLIGSERIVINVTVNAAEIETTSNVCRVWTVSELSVPIPPAPCRESTENHGHGAEDRSLAKTDDPRGDGRSEHVGRVVGAQRPSQVDSTAQ